MRICHYPECENYCEGTTDYCASHNYEQRRSAKDAVKFTKQQERKKAQRLAGMKEKRTPIKKASDKRKDQLALYAILRRGWIHGKLCEVEGCRSMAQDVHHKKGRDGDLLVDTRYFLAVCRPHHRYITDHPAESIAEGYSLSRTKTTQP